MAKPIPYGMHPQKCTVLKTSSRTFSDFAFDDKVAVECLLWLVFGFFQRLILVWAK
ncbi:hypothetical protein Hanom_Chr11g01035531 [Helianthus anomalus]